MRVNKLITVQYPFGAMGRPVMVPNTSQLLRSRECIDMFTASITTANALVAVTQCSNRVHMYNFNSGLIKKSPVIHYLGEADARYLAEAVGKGHKYLCDKYGTYFSTYDPVTCLQAIWDFLEDKEVAECW